MRFGINKLKEWLNKDEIEEKNPREVSSERNKLILNAVKEEAYRDIVKALQKKPEKYVVTDEPFSLAEKIGNSLQEDYDEEQKNTYQYVHEAGKDETKVTTYTPLDEYPGMYKAVGRTYKEGKQEPGVTIETKVMTWEQLTDSMVASRKLYIERLEADLYYPDNILATNDGKSFKDIEETWKAKEKSLFEKMPPKKIDLSNETLTDAEKVKVFLQKRWFDKEKDKMLGITHDKVITKQSFSFITSVTDTNEENVDTYAQVLATDTPWKKSPIDKEVVVHTFIPIPEYMKLSGEKSFKVINEIYKKGKLASKIQEWGTVDITWKNLIDMANMERQIHEAHLKAGGKFYPPHTLLVKDNKELKTEITKLSQSVKKVKGLRHQRQDAQIER